MVVRYINYYVRYTQISQPHLMYEKLVHGVHLCHYDRSQEGGRIQLGREEGRRERKKRKGRRGKMEEERGERKKGGR